MLSVHEEMLFEKAQPYAVRIGRETRAWRPMRAVNAVVQARDCKGCWTTAAAQESLSSRTISEG